MSRDFVKDGFRSSMVLFVIIGLLKFEPTAITPAEQDLRIFKYVNIPVETFKNVRYYVVSQFGAR